MVYLCFKYPDRYFLYKFEMFKDFIPMVEYPYQPIAGRIENIFEYQNLARLIRNEIIVNRRLLDLHRRRISRDEFFDVSYNILTQDVIYAATHYFADAPDVPVIPASQRLRRVDKLMQTSVIPPLKLMGRITNWLDNQRERQKIGDLGEMLVIDWERERLLAAGIDKNPEHSSKTEGDGLGYDILSYDDNGDELFIEVKTTEQGYDAPFMITRSELEKSNVNPSAFTLYRLYDFDILNNTAKFIERRGSLGELCLYPRVFDVRLR